MLCYSLSKTASVRSRAPTHEPPTKFTFLDLVYWHIGAQFNDLANKVTATYIPWLGDVPSHCLEVGKALVDRDMEPGVQFGFAMTFQSVLGSVMRQYSPRCQKMKLTRGVQTYGFYFQSG